MSPLNLASLLVATIATGINAKAADYPTFSRGFYEPRRSKAERQQRRRARRQRGRR